MRAILQLKSGAADRKKYVLLPERAYSMGRSQQAEVKLTDPKVSRRHCRFELGDDGRWVLEDLDSNNGTYVNDERIDASALESGDRVRAGNTVFLFLLENAIPARPASGAAPRRPRATGQRALKIPATPKVPEPKRTARQEPPPVPREACEGAFEAPESEIRGGLSAFKSRLQGILRGLRPKASAGSTARRGGPGSQSEEAAGKQPRRGLLPAALFGGALGVLLWRMPTPAALSPSRARNLTLSAALFTLLAMATMPFMLVGGFLHVTLLNFEAFGGFAAICLVLTLATAGLHFFPSVRTRAAGQLASSCLLVLFVGALGLQTMGEESLQSPGVGLWLSTLGGLVAGFGALVQLKHSAQVGG